MMKENDPLQRWFTVLRDEQDVHEVDARLERKLIHEMKDFATRRRRSRLVAVTLGIAMFYLAGGVHAAGGLQAIRHWFSEVKSIEIHFGGDDIEPRVLLRNEAGDVVGQGRLPPANERGDYRARVLTDKGDR